MKSLKPLFLLLFFPAFAFTQSLNGVYTGVLSNDSTTVRKDQSFEMALTEYKGKVYGYAYSTFIVNDTLYYILKRVKGEVEGDICEVEDDEVITHNFPQKPEKKVFVTYTLRRNASDSAWRLDGNWKTNLVNKRRYGYYSISGKVETKEEKDLAKSKLYEHLGDLDLQNTVVLAKPTEKAPETKTTKPKDDKADIARNTVKKDEKNNNVAKPGDKKPDASIAKTDTKIPDNKVVQVNAQPVSNEKKDVAAINSNPVADKKTEPAVSKTDIKTTDNKTSPNLVNNPPQNEKKDIASSNSNVTDKKPENNITKTDPGIPDNKTVPASTNDSQVQNVTKDAVSTNQPANSKKPDVVKIESQQNSNTVTNPVNTQPNQNAKKDVVATNNVDKNQPATIPAIQNKPQDSKPIATNNPPKQDEKKAIVPANTNAIAKTETKTPDNKTNNAVVNRQAVNEKKDVVVNDKKGDAGFEFQEVSRSNRTLKPAAKLVDGRATAPSETIYFKSDSLSIALYDNGEVDGDTVSVIINDEMFIDKQGLKSSAFRKTFYIPQGQSDSLLVVLYANNLGKYPPNTGLLQIKDGEEIFYVRFKADLDKNAAIVLRRKSK
jgi:hypothetical protein